MLIKAFIVALRAHKGQKDKAGKPYIFHPITVSLHVSGIKRKEVALLHDVVEDTPITVSDLRTIGFGYDVVEAVNAITKRNGESYCEYLQRVKENDIAKDVKMSDLRHNCNLKRLKTVTDKDKSRVEKYINAIDYLQQC